MRTPFIAGNWKMFKTSREAAEYAKDLTGIVKESNHKNMIAPPFTSIPAVAEIVKGTNLLLGAQNMSDHEDGAHTGEVSVIMLKELGVQVVILGHSERRLVYGEDDSFINSKVHLALKHGLEIILCIGETLEQREAGQVEEVVKNQVKNGLNGVSKELISQITLAYEPVWAIGTGKTATPEDADGVHKVIRTFIGHLYDQDTANNICIQYGGSVKPDNVKELMAKENIDGALVGGASLKIETFRPIIEFNS